jgi:precorrin-6B methylase 2
MKKSCLILVLAVLATVAHSQATPQMPYRLAPPSQDGIGKFYYQREIAQVMGYEGAGWLERPDRAEEERPDLLLAALSLGAGMSVADIGAGSGYLSKRMAALIAPGRLYAVDVQPQMVELLKELSAQAGTRNVVPVLGSADNVNLPKDAIDLAVMVDTYHELSQPYEIMRSVIAALKRGGRLVLVEYRGEDARVAIKPLHKMSVAQVRLEMRQFPLTFERADERLPVQHIVVFTKN